MLSHMTIVRTHRSVLFAHDLVLGDESRDNIEERLEGWRSILDFRGCRPKNQKV